MTFPVVSVTLKLNEPCAVTSRFGTKVRLVMLAAAITCPAVTLVPPSFSVPVVARQ